MTIQSSGNISVINGKIIVDGKDVTPDAKEISIEVFGNVDRLQVDECQVVSIAGDAGKVSTMSGKVEVVGDVKGNVSTMSGKVVCGNVGGSVSTMSGKIERN